MIYRDGRIVIVPAPQNIVTIVTAEFLPPVARFLANKGRTAHIPDYAEEKRLWAVSEPNRARIYYRQKTAWNQSAEHRDCSSEFSGSISLQEKATAPKGAAAVHIGRQCRPKNGVVTAFSEICIVAAIRGCRVHLFQILASKTGLLK